MLLQILHVCVAAQEPQQLVDDALQVQFLRGKQGKSLAEVKAHLMAEDALRTRTGAVTLRHAFVENAA